MLKSALYYLYEFKFDFYMCLNIVQLWPKKKKKKKKKKKNVFFFFCEKKKKDDFF